jgi:hypothetical protein
MRFDSAIIPLEPRSTGNCLDLALLLLRHEFRPIFAIWVTICVPVCALVYVLVDRFGQTMAAGLVAFFVASSPLGVLVTAGAAPCAFGERFTFAGTLRRLGWHGVWLVILGLFWRAVMATLSVVLLIPGWYVAVRTGFFVEQWALSKIARHLHDRQTNELLRGEIGDLMFRGAAITAFCMLLWVVLLVTAETLLPYLTGFSIFSGRFQADMSYFGDDFEAMFSYAVHFIWTDPVVVTSALAAALAVYPLGRLAWFLCYIDVRVRRDCWDVELKVLQAARNLEAT